MPSFFPAVRPQRIQPPVPSDFEIGFANCGYQAWGRKGGGESDWTQAADNGTVPEPGFSYNHYDNYEADINQMAASGVNSYRISIDWADIMNEDGQLIDKGLQFYKKLFAHCKARNLKVMATLLHFTQPIWFVKKGGFEKAENIHHFVTFGKKMVEIFKDDVDSWCTMNEPGIQAFSAYLIGLFPPHKHNLQQMVEVLLNLLKAHVALYKGIKEQDATAEVGLVHNVLRFKPRFYLEPGEALIANFLTEINDDLVMNFLKTGKFDYEKIGIASLHYEDTTAVGTTDFVGLNFYANAVIGLNTTNFFGPTCFPGQKMGDLALTVDPEGLRDAIKRCATLNKPIKITELGVADTSDNLRVELTKTCLAVVDEMRATHNVTGLYMWTFKANYEWGYGFSKLFGMVRRDGTQTESGLFFAEYAKRNGWVNEVEFKQEAQGSREFTDRPALTA